MALASCARRDWRGGVRVEIPAGAAACWGCVRRVAGAVGIGECVAGLFTGCELVVDEQSFAAARAGIAGGLRAHGRDACGVTVAVGGGIFDGGSIHGAKRADRRSFIGSNA